MREQGGKETWPLLQTHFNHTEWVEGGKAEQGRVEVFWCIVSAHFFVCLHFLYLLVVLYMCVCRSDEHGAYKNNVFKIRDHLL